MNRKVLAKVSKSQFMKIRRHRPTLGPESSPGDPKIVCIVCVRARACVCVSACVCARVRGHVHFFLGREIPPTKMGKFEMGMVEKRVFVLLGAEHTMVGGNTICKQKYYAE